MKKKEKKQSSSLGALTQELMAMDVPADISDELPDLVASLGWRRTGSTMLVSAIWLKALKGDGTAAKLLRELTGESVGDDEAVDLSAISDAVLKKLAGGIFNEK